MKKTAFTAIICLLVVACTKDSQVGPSLVGKWQLTAIFLQPTGVGSWYTEDSIPPDYVQFNADGTLNMSPYVSSLFGSPSNYKISSDSTIMVHFPSPREANNFFPANSFYFKLTDSVLLIYPPNMELVIEKFIKVQSGTSPQ
jgi:hypothetical protein